ncbi:hypothetical protein SAY87_017155 [Trapa incisa]|uniref:AP2/ERF domain-containing protein n=1 Tax=Trapa incisa TaxID=236973 RepID=A0AAN7LBD7_9MYRT|nr:hypothetical protein SAY87_017155 [Trapa incisa]
MAPPATNWLSFSLSPVETLTTSSSHSATASASAASNLIPLDQSAAAAPLLLFDNLYYQGLGHFTDRSEILFPEPPAHQHYQFLNQTIPKLEDFFGESQTEAQDSSSLTHLYDSPAGIYFSDQTSLKAIAGALHSFPANSGSEIDDSVSMGRASQAHHQLTEFAGHSVDSLGHEMGVFSSMGPTADQLSLAVANVSKTAAISRESDGSKKVADTFGQRTSIYRGVTRHRWTGRYEAHLWDNSCRREGQARKGRQGGYDKEDKAARAYDLAALKYWGPSATTNFPVSNYTKELEEMKYMTKQEFIASLRRKSSGFSRGASIYRGVTRHHQQGRWQARIGRVAGNKDLYLGTFATEEEAAEAYDIAAIKFRGANAVTNFEMNRYDVEAISNSTLPIGGAAKRLKPTPETEQKPPALIKLDRGQLHHQSPQANGSTNISFGLNQHLTAPSIALEAGSSSLYNSSNIHQLQANVGIPYSSIPSFTVPQAGEFFLWPNLHC